jgi:hypothetical protein
MSYELRPCGHLAAEGSTHPCDPLEGLLGVAVTFDPERIIELGEPEPAPPRWRCQSCGSVRETSGSTSSSYCTGDPSRARRHPLTARELAP